MPSSNPNSSKASRNNMNSNRTTDIFVGGGEKKAGLPPTVPRSTAGLYARNEHGYAQPLSVMILPLVSTVCVSRPTGSNVVFNRYWKCTR